MEKFLKNPPKPTQTKDPQNPNIPAHKETSTLVSSSD